MTNLNFRHATHDDINAIVALVQSAYRGDASRAGWTTEADILDGQRIDASMLQAMLANPAATFLLAARDGTLIACCELQHNGDAAYFGMFSVVPTEQGSGIGKVVLAEAERMVRDEWLCSRLEMTVIDVRDALIAWYERRGYIRTGLHSPFPYGDTRYGIPLRDDLRFETLRKTFLR
ncbi:MAG: GNAT family N-acetyltransferase [Dokdonella sp.]